MSAQITRRLVIDVKVQRGNQADADRVLDDLLDIWNRGELAYASAGAVDVKVRRARARP